MFQIVRNYASQADQFIIDPSAEFQAGMIAQLKVLGNQVICGVSDGTAPLGIIDDVKTTSFSTTAINETVQALVPEYLTQTIAGVRYLRGDFQIKLDNPNVLPSSFISYDIPVHLIARNGILLFPEGTALNTDLDNSGSASGLRTIVSYSYQIPNIPGFNSTEGSDRVSVWVTRLRGQTDQFDTSVRYPISAPLFVNSSGKLTTSRTANYPSPAMVTGAPTGNPGFLEFLWL